MATATKAPAASKAPGEDTENNEAAEADAPLSNNFAEAVKKLLKRGKERGYVTVDEMNAALPPERVSSEQIEDVLAQLSEIGVNVVEADDVEEADSTSETEDYGRTDDPVRLYLREMGAVELLSREGEIAIAKRIEAGREMMIGGICESPLTIQAILDWNEALKDGRLLLRDIVDLEAMQEGDSDMPAGRSEEGAAEEGAAEEAEPAEGQEGEGADISSFDDEDNVSLAAIEEKLKPQVIETFDAIAKTSKKMMKTQHERAEAMSKGEPMPKGIDDKILTYKRDLVDLVRTVRFNNARLEQLVQQLYTLNRRLMGMEGKILRFALDCGLTREDFLERYYGHELDPHFYEHILLEPPPPPPPPKLAEMSERDRLIAGAVVRHRPLTRVEQKRLAQEQKLAAKQAEKDRIAAERAAKKAAKEQAKIDAKLAKEAARAAAKESAAKEKARKEAERAKLQAKKAAERERAEAKREREREKKAAARAKLEAKREAERKKKEIKRKKLEKERIAKAKKLAAQKKAKAKKAAQKKKTSAKKKPTRKAVRRPAPKKKPAKKKPAARKPAKKKPAKKAPKKRRR
ncbi:MAG: RNA polymerase sigma factor region1.1 domain-containing protein [Bdellovibrionales bacterium]